MPIINVSILSGRSLALRQKLMKDLTATAADCLQVDPGTIRVLLTEIPPEHWATGGVPKKPAPTTDPET